MKPIPLWFNWSNCIARTLRNVSKPPGETILTCLRHRQIVKCVRVALMTEAVVFSGWGPTEPDYQFVWINASYCKSRWMLTKRNLITSPLASISTNTDVKTKKSKVTKWVVAPLMTGLVKRCNFLFYAIKDPQNSFTTYLWNGRFANLSGYRFEFGICS